MAKKQCIHVALDSLSSLYSLYCILSLSFQFSIPSVESQKGIKSLFNIIIHTSLFFDEIKVRILFPSKGFVQWNAISLAYLHSVRVLRLSANVKFACNNVRLFNAGEISLQYSLRFFDIRMRRNSG